MNSVEQIQEIKKVLTKVLKEELVALISDKGENSLLLHFVGGAEFILKIEKA